MSPNPYEVLGIPIDADKKTIGVRFRTLAKEYHPDATGGDKCKEEHFKQLSAAYEILSDQRKRGALDDQLRAASARSSRSSSTKTRTNTQASKDSAPTSSAGAKTDGPSPGSTSAADEEWLGEMNDILDDLWANIEKGKDASPPNGATYKYTRMAMDSTRDAPKHKRLMLVCLAMLADTLKAVYVARPPR